MLLLGGRAQGTAGYQALGRGRPVSGPRRAPVRLVVRPLQNFHGLAAADGELSAVAGREVMDHHTVSSQPPDSWGGEGTGQPVCPHPGLQQVRLAPTPSCVRAQDAG